MSQAANTALSVWSLTWIRQHPVRLIAIVLNLLFRTLFGIFWIAAGVNKINKGWLTTDTLERIFLDRLTEIPPDAFAVFYLQTFAIPFYKVIAWFIAFGEIYAGFGLLLGCTTRWAAWMSLFILANLAIGGYYDASLIPFFILNFVFLLWPSGLWLGFDRILARRYPDSRWFR